MLAQEFEAGAAGGIAHELATKRRGGYGVAGVQREVGFVGTELFAVMCHVHAAVSVGSGEAGEAEQPTPNGVVECAILEQQAMRGLMHE